MPRKPLLEYKDAEQNDAEGDGEVPHEAAAVAGSNVGVMAKRIRQMERKERQVYQPPIERPLAGDLSSSESDDPETDSAAEASLFDDSEHTEHI